MLHVECRSLYCLCYYCDVFLYAATVCEQPRYQPMLTYLDNKKRVEVLRTNSVAQSCSFPSILRAHAFYWEKGQSIYRCKLISLRQDTRHKTTPIDAWTIYLVFENLKSSLAVSTVTAAEDALQTTAGLSSITRTESTIESAPWNA